MYLCTEGGVIPYMALKIKHVMMYLSTEGGVHSWHGLPYKNTGFIPDMVYHIKTQGFWTLDMIAI